MIAGSTAQRWRRHRCLLATAVVFVENLCVRCELVAVATVIIGRARVPLHRCDSRRGLASWGARFFFRYFWPPRNRLRKWRATLLACVCHLDDCCSGWCAHGGVADDMGDAWTAGRSLRGTPWGANELQRTASPLLCFLHRCARVSTRPVARVLQCFVALVARLCSRASGSPALCW